MNATLERPKVPDNSAQQPSASEHVDQQLPLKSTRSEVPSRVEAVATPAVTPMPSPVRAMNKKRFAAGLGLSSGGIAVLLFVAVGMLQRIGLNDWFSLPLVAIAAIAGVMMLGGGFGLMATAAPGFDDGEFERLMAAGNISSVSEDRSADDSNPLTAPPESADLKSSGDDCQAGEEA